MRVALYVTCLVDQFWPEVGIASVRLLRALGCTVHFDRAQTCCGQPFVNSGYPGQAAPLARSVVELAERSGADAVVLPSGSCTAQVRHYGELFADDPSLAARARAVAARTWELGQFLADVLHATVVPGRFTGSVGWHDACHGLRELGVRDQPRRLLGLVPGLELRELPHADACCGFGGTFAVKYPEISTAIGEHKLAAIEQSGVDVLTSGDASCLLHLRGLLRRRGSRVQVHHLAELLAWGCT